MGLVASPHRPHRHRTSRCLVLLWHRALSPPPRFTSRIPMADAVVRGRPRSAVAGAERAGARSERLLPVFHAHGAAPGAHPAVSSAASGRAPGMAAAAPARAFRGAASGAVPDSATGGGTPVQCLHRRVAHGAVLRSDDAEPRGAHRYPSPVHGHRHADVVAGHGSLSRAAAAADWYLDAVPVPGGHPYADRGRTHHFCRPDTLPLVRGGPSHLGALSTGRPAVGWTADVGARQPLDLRGYRAVVLQVGEGGGGR